MTTASTFDVSAGHRHFAAHCFNRAWELLDKPNRSGDDDIRLIATAQASLWHWLEREDRTPRSLSIGYWQLARVYAVVGKPAEAYCYAQLCLEQSEQEPAFYLGYAYEALARAAKVAGDDEQAAAYLVKAADYARQFAEDDDRAALEADLKTLA